MVDIKDDNQTSGQRMSRVGSGIDTGALILGLALFLAGPASRGSRDLVSRDLLVKGHQDFLEGSR